MTRLLQSTSVDTNLLPFQQPSEKTDKMSDLRATCICVCLCCDLVSVCMYAQIEYVFVHKYAHVCAYQLAKCVCCVCF